MKALVIVGTASGTKGRTGWLLERFIAGMEEAGASVETIKLIEKDIKLCKGQLQCWFKTPGKCIINDDVKDILPIIDASDTVVLATPVYIDGMTGLLKNFLDRMVPSIEPFLQLKDGHTRHVPLRDTAGKFKRIALVSPCVYPELDTFDPLIVHVKAITKNLNAEFAGCVLRPTAMALDYIKEGDPEKYNRISEAVKKAGMELIRDGRISDETTKAAAEPILMPEEFVAAANAQYTKVLEELEKKSTEENK